MSIIAETEEDFGDLDQMLVEIEATERASADVAAKRRRLKKDKLSEDERQRLTAEVRTYEALFVWRSTANVALFATQHCAVCGHIHSLFQGWMTSQDHRTDHFARRLIKGRTVGLPERREEHDQGTVEMCSDCADACLIINDVMGQAETAAVAHERAATLDNQRAVTEARAAANARPGVRMVIDPTEYKLGMIRALWLQLKYAIRWSQLHAINKELQRLEVAYQDYHKYRRFLAAERDIRQAKLADVASEFFPHA